MSVAREMQDAVRQELQKAVKQVQQISQESSDLRGFVQVQIDETKRK